MNVKILSWNIWRGKNLDDVIDFLKKEDADVIGLQEVIEDDEHSQAEIIAKALGYNLVFGKAFRTDRHERIYTIGNAILSRFPIRHSQVLMLSTLEDYKGSAATEPRNAVFATISIGEDSLRFVTTHLLHTRNNIPSELRVKQAQGLTRELTGKKTVLVGDFNSLPDDPALKIIGERLITTNSDPKLTTWISDEGDKYRIDYILVSPDIKFSNFRVLDSSASDHKPISVNIELP